MTERADPRPLNAAVIVAYCLVIILTLAFIFGNSLLSKAESSDQSGAVVDTVKPVVDPNDEIPREDFEHVVRKLAHFAEFCLLGIELMLFVLYIGGGFDLKNAVCVAFLGLLCANIDELLQKYTERGSEVSDVFIDFGGVVIGILLGHAIVWMVGAAIKRKKEKTTEPLPIDGAAEQ